MVIRHLVMATCLFLMAVEPSRAALPTLPMQVTVHPNPMRADTMHAYVEVKTQPRIVCVGFILLDNGLFPRSFPHAQTHLTSYAGTAIWAWSDKPTAGGGTASVSCNNSIVTRTVNVHFRVQPVPKPVARSAAVTGQRSRMLPFSVRAVVSPNPIIDAPYFTSLTAHTSDGARCVAGLFYNDGAVAQAFAGYPQLARNGAAIWHWHVNTQSGGGTATVTCTFGGRTLVATALFTVKRP